VKYPVSGSSVDKNAVLMPEVRGLKWRLQLWQFWRQSGTSKVYLIKWPVGVYTLNIMNLGTNHAVSAVWKCVKWTVEICKCY